MPVQPLKFCFTQLEVPACNRLDHDSFLVRYQETIRSVEIWATAPPVVVKNCARTPLEASDYEKSDVCFSLGVDKKQPNTQEFVG
jgi:hypothetical protein